MIQIAARRHAHLLAAGVALAVGACGGRAPAPSPGTSQGSPPDLRGSRVMVLPVQAVRGIDGDADAELAFGLRDRGAGVTWILPRELDDALERSPGLNARTRGLAVGIFSAAEVRRIGDPLYGEIRRLATLVDAGVALLPVSAEGVPDGDGAVAVRFSVAVAEVRTGRVLWFGVVQGDPFPRGDPRGLASGVDELARTLLWYGVA